MKWIMILCTFFCLLQTAIASNLESRNIPDARLLFEDESGRYYGAMMSFYNRHPRAGSSDTVVLQVYAERKVDVDGLFYNGILDTVKEKKGTVTRNIILIDPSEMKRLSDHVIPAISRVFPEWRSHKNWQRNKDRLQLNVYIENVYLNNMDFRNENS